LDIVAQHDREDAAYAWNAEAYHYDWRTPYYRLDEGDYRVLVTVSSQNGPLYMREFDLHVDANFANTQLRTIR